MNVYGLHELLRYNLWAFEACEQHLPALQTTYHRSDLGIVVIGYPTLLQKALCVSVLLIRCAPPQIWHSQRYTERGTGVREGNELIGQVYLVDRFPVWLKCYSTHTGILPAPSVTYS
jgi:hypothetical protein